MMSTADKQLCRIEWSGITIEISYTPSWSAAYREVYGDDLAHLEVRSIAPERAPLPITPTGYHSLFLPRQVFEAEGGPVCYVQRWLATKANDPAWKESEHAARQLSLF